MQWMPSSRRPVAAARSARCWPPGRGQQPPRSPVRPQSASGAPAHEAAARQAPHHRSCLPEHWRGEPGRQPRPLVLRQASRYMRTCLNQYHATTPTRTTETQTLPRVQPLPGLGPDPLLVGRAAMKPPSCSRAGQSACRHAVTAAGCPRAQGSAGAATPAPPPLGSPAERSRQRRKARTALAVAGPLQARGVAAAMLLRHDQAPQFVLKRQLGGRASQRWACGARDGQDVLEAAWSSRHNYSAGPGRARLGCPAPPGSPCEAQRRRSSLLLGP